MGNFGKLIFNISWLPILVQSLTTLRSNTLVNFVNQYEKLKFLNINYFIKEGKIS